LALVLMLPAISIADSYMTGGRLAQFVHDHELFLDKKADNKETKYALYYQGYITGASDILMALGKIPASMPVNQFSAIVEKYTNDHPELWDKPASQLILQAINRFFSDAATKEPIN